MTADNWLLWAAYAAILPAWLMLIAAPSWRWTQALCRTIAVSLALCGVYVALLVLNLPNATDGAGVWSMEQLVLLFSSRSVVLIGWVHYLAFDLFVGSWVASDAAARQLSRVLVAPCLLLVLMVGPAGLLSYAVLRRVISGSWSVFGDALIRKPTAVR
ncbi:MAG: DUF4281 domain-containing protein [Myxococcales bacterium]|nr:DUF4281 domain-containing protein [Myxococcales bacterium]